MQGMSWAVASSMNRDRAIGLEVNSDFLNQSSHLRLDMSSVLQNASEASQKVQAAQRVPDLVEAVLEHISHHEDELQEIRDGPYSSAKFAQQDTGLFNFRGSRRLGSDASLITPLVSLRSAFLESDDSRPASFRPPLQQQPKTQPAVVQKVVQADAADAAESTSLKPPALSAVTPARFKDFSALAMSE